MASAERRGDLLARYRADCQRRGYSQSHPQRQVLAAMQGLCDQLRGGGRDWRRLWRRAPPPPGIYLWGAVGRGKTWLMDLCCQHLQGVPRQRQHFHHFMQQVHESLRQCSGHSDPLRLVAARLRRRARILFLDEFIVDDIGDAMILAGLLRAMFDCGMVLATTSNTPPEQLYKDGLQRQRFEPVIGLLQRHTRVLHLGGDGDYRLRALRRMSLYHHPLGAASDAAMERAFGQLADGPPQDATHLRIAGRNVAVRRLGGGLAWFDFRALCDGPRSQRDYGELVARFHILFISGVPRFCAMDDQARRFIGLVDQCYDRRVRLVLSAAAPLPALYHSGRLAAPFQRTTSRLTQMQSADWPPAPGSAPARQSAPHRDNAVQ